MPKRRRIIKKKIKEPDEFISTSSIITNYVKNNYRNIIPVAVIALVVSLIIFGWFYYSKGREKEAANLFYQSKRFYQSVKNSQTAGQPAEEMYRLALEKFENVKKQYAGTSSNTEALFYIGDCYYHLRKYDKSINYYQQFIDKSGKDDYLRCFAFEGLGYCYEEKGDYEKALNYFKKSADESVIDIKELEYLNIARCYEALNDRVNALQFYKKFIDSQSESIFLELAQKKVEALKD